MLSFPNRWRLASRPPRRTWKVPILKREAFVIVNEPVGSIDATRLKPS